MAEIHQLLPNRAFGVTSCNNSSQVIIDRSCLVSWCGCCDDILLWLSTSPTSFRGVRLKPCTLIHDSRFRRHIRNTACDRRYTHVSRSRVSMSPSSCLTSLGSLPRPRAAPLDLSFAKHRSISAATTKSRRDSPTQHRPTSQKPCPPGRVTPTLATSEESFWAFILLSGTQVTRL